MRVSHERKDRLPSSRLGDRRGRSNHQPLSLSGKEDQMTGHMRNDEDDKKCSNFCADFALYSAHLHRIVQASRY